MALEQPVSVGMIGGTGPAGRAFAARLASLGLQVRIGSRSADRAAWACAKIADKWPGHGLEIIPATNADAADADLAVIATPWDAAAAMAAEYARNLAGKVVISMANAITITGREFQPVFPARGSIATEIQAAVPRSLVVAAMHHVPARELGDLARPVDCDVLVCSDHSDGKHVVMRLLGAIPGLRAIDAGNLSAATAVEALTAVLLGVNLRYSTRSTIRLNGLGAEHACAARLVPGEQM